MTADFDIVVIGGGVAGLTATNHALQGVRSVAHVLGLEAIGGLVCNVGQLSGYPAGGEPLSGIDKAISLSAANAEAGVNEVYAEAVAIRSDGDQFRIETSDGEIVASSVIAATGARLRMLDVPGASELVGRGVSQCAWCDGALYRNKNVVVVGGGDAALEEALHLAQFASRVTVVTRGAGLRARRSYVDRLSTIENVGFRSMCDVLEVFGEAGVEGIRLHDRANARTEDMPCDGVFVFIGLEPNSALLEGLVELDQDRRVATDRFMQTRTPGLYAVGAVRSGYHGRLVHAVGEAATAAMAAVENSGR